MFSWLKDYQTLQDKINYLEFKIDFAKKEIDQYDLVDERKDKAISEIAGLNKELKLCNDKKSALVKLVYTFKGIDQEILRKKYIEGKKLQEVADELNYTYEYIKRRHANIVRTINVIDEWRKSNL